MPDFVDHVGNLKRQVTEEANQILERTDTYVQECLDFLRQQLQVSELGLLSISKTKKVKKTKDTSQEKTTSNTTFGLRCPF
jgi:hypothetical protein